MAELQAWIASKTTETTAARYLSRLRAFCRQLRSFPERGTLRTDLRPGLRTITFEGRVEVAFEVDLDRVVIVRFLYAGRQYDSR